MQQIHLTYEEFERYLDGSDLSEEYLIWMEGAMQHLESCEHCQDMLRKMILISEVCEEENTKDMLALLEKEEEIRRELIALQLESVSQELWVSEALKRFRTGMAVQLMAAKADFLKKQSVARGVHSKDALPKITVEYQSSVASIKVFGDKEKEVTVILALEDDLAAEPMIARAVWSETERAAVAEFYVEQLGENYRIYML